MESVLLNAAALDVHFGSFRAVRGVTMQLRAGDLLGLIGPNGAGKTTLLRALTGLQPLTNGKVEILGDPVDANGRDHWRRLGFTPDSPSVYEAMTVRDFLRYVADGYHINPSLVNERIDFWLEKVWLLEKRHQKIKGLSRGMRQRLGIARTLLADPAVILLDEPAAGLDPAGRVQFRELLCDLRNQGKALIVSSHILADMDEYCTHIGIMSQGRLVKFGTVHEIATHDDGGRCKISITLAGATDGLADFFTHYDGAEKVQITGERVTLEYSSDKAHMAKLLAALVQRGYPVAGFHAETSGLEEAYLRTGIAQVD